MTSCVLVRSVLQTRNFSAIRGVTLRLNTGLKPPVLQQGRSVATKTDVEENIQKYKEGNFEKIPDATHLDHFKKSSPKVIEQPIGKPPKSPLPIGTHALPHPIWSAEQLENVSITHKPPEGFVDKSAYFAVQFMRKSFDFISGFSWGTRTEKKWVNRICFLETVAGVPGMVAAMTRHLHSLRRLQRDYGWIHTLLEEAENERMHLMTALQLKKPNWFFRAGVITTQGVFVTMFSLSYLVSPRFCHRFVGYLEEEAVKTYSKCLADIESGALQHWKTQAAPDLAIRYWQMKEESTMRDVVLTIRADEAHHRLVNHTLASMKETDYNPYKPGK